MALRDPSLYCISQKTAPDVIVSRNNIRKLQYLYIAGKHCRNEKIYNHSNKRYIIVSFIIICYYYDYILLRGYNIIL